MSSIYTSKYSTVDELKTAPIRTIIQTVSKMEPSEKRDHLDAWLYDTHYRLIPVTGNNLTSRIKAFDNEICYRELMKRCFENTDIASISGMSKTILPLSVTDFIRDLHAIEPSMTGVFMDYLIRRIICEITKTTFNDSRANCILHPFSSHECNPVPVNYQEYTKQALLNLCKQQVNLRGYSKMNKAELAQFVQENISTASCKLEIVQFGKRCILPVCQRMSYKKTTCIHEYRTYDIIPDIFLTSLTHGETFGGAPSQESVNQIYEKLTKKENLAEQFIAPLYGLCSELLSDHTRLLLNPTLGWRVEKDAVICADADIVIDDIIFDIKCTKSLSSSRYLLQLLGYAALLMARTEYAVKINTVSVINLIHGTILYYPIKFMNHDHCMAYLRELIRAPQTDNQRSD